MNKEKPAPDWMLERYLLDELPRKERRQMEKELERDAGLRAELEKLRQTDRRILAMYPADQMLPQILKRAALARPEASAPRHWRLAWMAAPVLALALLLLVILPPVLQRRLTVSGTSRPGEYTATKGSKPHPLQAPCLRLYQRNGDAGRILSDGETARAGDLLQLAYTAGGQTHGVILSIDGGGSITLHFPQGPDADTTLQSGGRILLANSFELDSAPRFERFFFITGNEPLPTVLILKKARTLAAAGGDAMTGQLDLPVRFRQYSLLVRKRDRT